MKNRIARKAQKTVPPYRQGGRYATLLVGPMFGLASLCAQAQEQTPAQAAPAQTATPGTTSAPVAASASAQAKPPATETSNAQGKDGVTLNTVVVTANRRREPAREVPMQVNVLSSDELQKSGAKTLTDYLTTEPGVDLNNGGGSGSGQVSIRGVTTGNQTGPTVGTYIDDVAFGGSTFYSQSATFALDMSLLDLNHIEILRGPQGTLYGAGAMGGLLKYVTNEPDSEQFSGQAGTGMSVTEHGGLNTTANATVNIPLKEDVAALRVSAFGEHDAGYVNTLGQDAGSRVDHSETTGARASLLLTPTKDLTVRLSAITQNINRNAPNYVEYGPNEQPVYGDLTTRQDAPEPFHQNIQLYSAGVEYELGWARLNSISSYQSVNTSDPQDLSSVYVPLLGAAGVDLNSVVAKNLATTNKFTQEFRLTSPANQKLEWLAGLYYTHERSDLNQGFVATLPNGSAAPDLSEVVAPSTYNEYAAYGDLTYHLTPRLSLTGGMRVAHNNQTYQQTTYGLLAGPMQTITAPSSDTSKTYMITASYALTKTSNLYVRAASGYRPGGPNAHLVDPLTGLPTPGSATFQPDTLWSYEAGYKADLFDKRLSLAVSAYDIEWKDIQQIGTVDGVGQVINAGNARIKGLEFSSTYRPDRHWDFSASLSLIDALLTTGDASSSTVAGEPLPNSAKSSATLSASYQFTAAGSPSYVGISQQFVSMRHAGFNGSSGSPDYALPGYALTNLQAGMDFKHFSVAFYVRNVFDRRALLAAGTSLVPLGGPVLVSVNQPRTIGTTVTIPF